MAKPETESPWTPRKVLITAVILSIILGGATGFATSFLSRPAPKTQTREFYVFPEEQPFDSTVAGIPHYIFIPDRIVVNKGDNVTIHFYDTTDESHTFTLPDPYAVDKVLPAATATNIPKTDVSFVANTIGIFVYHCRFHPPTMTGNLIVQG